MLKPRVGDLVRQKPMRVTRVYASTGVSDGWVECSNGTCLGFGEIEEVLPRPLAVGDRVSFMVAEPDCPSGVRGTVLAVSKSTFLWILRDDDCYETRDASSVRRVETEGRT